MRLKTLLLYQPLQYLDVYITYVIEGQAIEFINLNLLFTCLLYQ